MLRDKMGGVDSCPYLSCWISGTESGIRMKSFPQGKMLASG